MSETPNTGTKPVEPQDGCPKWAVDVIRRIRDLEIQLRNINPSDDWKVANLKDLFKSTDDQEADASFDESVVETLFQQVARGLSREGHDPRAIAEFVNSRIPSGRLPYCNAEEVRDAIDENPQ